MNSQSVVDKKSFFEKIKANCENFWLNLSEAKQSILKKLWKILTYKWQWQLALNAPFLIIWILDKNISSVHQFDMYLLHSLPIPEWAYSFM